MFFLLAALLQAAPSSALIAERQGLPAPPLPDCAIPGAGKPVARLADLPPAFQAELERGFRSARGLAEAGAPYNATDVVDPRLPSRRFVGAVRFGTFWIVWYEHGGIVHSRNIIGVHFDAAADSYHLLSGTTLIGEPCRALRAVLDGVRTGTP